MEKKKEQFKEEIMRLDMRDRKSIEDSKIYSKQYSNPDLLNYKPNSILTKEEHENIIGKIK